MATSLSAIPTSCLVKRSVSGRPRRRSSISTCLIAMRCTVRLLPLVQRPGAEDPVLWRRHGCVKDPWGNLWWAASHVEDVSEEEIAERAKTARPQ